MVTGMTVREVLQLPELAKVTVVGGAGGLDRVICAVNVMEVPDISPYVESGELLLTTTYPIRSDPTALKRLVPTLAQRGLAGLGIKPARYLDDIPDEMVQQADALDFPLLRLPTDASFTRLLNPILAEILNRQAAVLRRSESVHRILTDLVLQGAGFKALAGTLASLLALPVAITSGEFELLAYSENSRDQADPFLAFLEKLKSEGLYPSGGTPVQRSLWVGTQLSTVLIHPVQVGSEVCGYICVWERDGKFCDRDVVCIEQAAVVTALEFQKQRAVRETERRFWDDFVRELLAGRISGREEALARAAIYGCDLTGPRVLLLVKLEGTRGIALSLDQAVRYRERLERTVRHVIADAGTRCLHANLGDAAVLLFSPSRVTAEAVRDETVKLAREIVAELKSGRFGQKYSVRIGVSRLHHEITTWPEAYREAREALRIGTLVGSPDLVTHYDDLGLYRLLTRVEDEEEMERFCRETLGEILAYDARHNTNLLETLCAVIEADGNLQRAAENLFIHYNTLRYRLQRITEIQGLRIESLRDMIRADIAIKAYRVLQARRA